jgi:hypothetical protein
MHQRWGKRPDPSVLIHETISVIASAKIVAKKAFLTGRARSYAMVATPVWIIKLAAAYIA